MAARPGVSEKPNPPFPMRQMLILAICRICEPIAFMSIFPYVYQMVKDFHMTEDTDQISFYAGMVTSCFTFAEFSTGFLWGRLSDKIGRKPVLLIGMAGTGLSVLIFGFSPNLAVALFARALGGLLNGNIGVLQTTIAELITVKEHQHRAYTVMPLVWCIGSIIGPMIGGALAEPVASFPGIFTPGGLFDRFPYLLPNLFSALCVFFGLIVGILFLEETHAEKKRQRDRGLEVGNFIISKIPSCRWAGGERKPEKQPLLAQLDGEVDEDLPGYRSTESSPRLMPLPEPTNEPQDLSHSKAPAKIFTRDVVLNIVSYGILAFHTMTYDSLLPTFLSTPPPTHPQPASLPFKFVDGFGFTTSKIGVIMAVQGAYAIVSNGFIVAPVSKQMGYLRLFKLIACSYFTLYLVTPYLVLLPESLRMVGIYSLIVFKNTLGTLAYPSNAVLLANSAPSQLSLGTINGIAASTASLCRTLGPLVSGALYTFGLQTGYSVIPWWVSGAVTIVGAFISLQLREPKGRLDDKPADEEMGSIESLEAQETNTTEQTA
ncbi:MFS general substrate transporter [Thozetella sp. PMI_491]|nr:MFS general substrate transporter [Thozetella sp. PMI_491]